MYGEVLHHVWAKVELTFGAEKVYVNPYTEVEVWVDLEGPGFAKRVYGFWDGGSAFKVRLAVPAAGEWRWTSGSNVPDRGLRGHRGGFYGIPWDPEELEANACRRGFPRPIASGHALEYPDGTPCFLVGDTWWAVPTHRFRWYDDDAERPIGPDMGLKDMVRFRKAQGYNCIAILAAFPNWNDDGLPPLLETPEGLTVRAAWPKSGTASAKDMHNEGGRPFFFPGRVPGFEQVFPDVDRLNPEYFRFMDRKIDYLNSQGFIPFIEVMRRDGSQPWQKFYGWPESYARYIQYVFSRYQANNCIFSPIHFDSGARSIPSRDYNAPANLVLEKYGPPPFGTLVSCNASGSSLSNFGNSDEAPWLTLHQIGNQRHHNSHWQLTELYRYCVPPKPALNGEPYYPGFPPSNPLPPDSAEADLYARSGMYGSFLSGGLAGHIYGAVGLWGADVETEAPWHMWDALQFHSGAQMEYFRDFVWSEGTRFQELVPDNELVYPNKNYTVEGNRGWAYCARTPARDLFMVYFEADCPPATVRGALYERPYHAQWFDPRIGQWQDAGELRSTAWCEVKLPPQPSGEDWALKLTAVE